MDHAKAHPIAASIAESRHPEHPTFAVYNPAWEGYEWHCVTCASRGTITYRQILDFAPAAKKSWFARMLGR